MLLLKCLVRDVFIKPASAAKSKVDVLTGELKHTDAQPEKNYAVVEHQTIGFDGVIVLKMENVKLPDSSIAAFKQAIGKEIIVAVNHGSNNMKDWFNACIGQMPVIQSPKAQ